MRGGKRHRTAGVYGAPGALHGRGVPAREQFELWRGLGDRHLLSPAWEREGPSGVPFRGVMRVRQLGGTRFVDLRSEGHRIRPGAAAAARAAADVCIVEQEIVGPAS